MFDILCIVDSFSLQEEFDRNVITEDVDDLEFGHQDSTVKFEIVCCSASRGGIQAF